MGYGPVVLPCVFIKLQIVDQKVHIVDGRQYYWAGKFVDCRYETRKCVDLLMKKI